MDPNLPTQTPVQTTLLSEWKDHVASLHHKYRQALLDLRNENASLKTDLGQAHAALAVHGIYYNRKRPTEQKRVLTPDDGTQTQANKARKLTDGPYTSAATNLIQHRQPRVSNNVVEATRPGYSNAPRSTPAASFDHGQPQVNNHVARDAQSGYPIAPANNAYSYQNNVVQYGTNGVTDVEIRREEDSAHLSVSSSQGPSSSDQGSASPLTMSSQGSVYPNQRLPANTNAAVPLANNLAGPNPTYGTFFRAPVVSVPSPQAVSQSPVRGKSSYQLVPVSPPSSYYPQASPSSSPRNALLLAPQAVVQARLGHATGRGAFTYQTPRSGFNSNPVNKRLIQAQAASFDSAAALAGDQGRGESQQPTYVAAAGPPMPSMYQTPRGHYKPNPAPWPAPNPAPKLLQQALFNPSAADADTEPRPAPRFLGHVERHTTLKAMRAKVRFRKASGKPARPWLFNYRFPGTDEWGIYYLACPMTACGAITRHPLVKKRGQRHICECMKLKSIDVVEMMLSYAVQVIDEQTSMHEFTYQLCRAWNIGVMKDNNDMACARENFTPVFPASAPVPAPALDPAAAPAESMSSASPSPAPTGPVGFAAPAPMAPAEAFAGHSSDPAPSATTPTTLASFCPDLIDPAILSAPAPTGPAEAFAGHSPDPVSALATPMPLASPYPDLVDPAVFAAPAPMAPAEAFAGHSSDPASSAPAPTTLASPYPDLLDLLDYTAPAATEPAEAFADPASDPASAPAAPMSWPFPGPAPGGPEGFTAPPSASSPPSASDLVPDVSGGYVF